jgi:hypothetical protein
MLSFVMMFIVCISMMRSYIKTCGEHIVDINNLAQDLDLLQSDDQQFQSSSQIWLPYEGASAFGLVAPRTLDVVAGISTKT